MLPYTPYTATDMQWFVKVLSNLKLQKCTNFSVWHSSAGKSDLAFEMMSDLFLWKSLSSCSALGCQYVLGETYVRDDQ